MFMNGISKICATLAVVGALTGCQAFSAANDAVSTVSESKQLETICSIAPLAHNAFLLISQQTQINEKIVQSEFAAYEVVRTVCRSRPTNVVEALYTVTEAYENILALQADVVEAKAENTINANGG